MVQVKEPHGFLNGYARARWLHEQGLLKGGENYFGPRGRGSALHNMSCPPRTRIAIRPLGIHEQSRSLRPGEHAQACASGLQLVTRLSVDRLIREWFPAFRVANKNADVVYWADRKTLKGRATNMANLRLRCLVVLSRLAIGEISEVTRRSVYALVDVSTESLETAYIENTVWLDPRACGLPAFGLVHLDADHDSRAFPFELEPARALAFLSRSAGTVFSADRTPVVPQHARHKPPIALLAFAPSGGEAAHD